MPLKQLRESFANNTSGPIRLPDGNTVNLQPLEDSFNNLTEKFFEEQSKLTEILLIGRLFYNEQFSVPVKRQLQKNHYQLLNPTAKEKYEELASFLGASILSQIKNFKNHCVTV